jgi:hypothetical protein
MYVWSGSAWVSVATEVESLATYATQSYADAQPGMKLVVPTSVAVGSGTGSVSTQGTVTFSGASSVSLNDVFTTTYDHYKILFNVSSSLGSAEILSLRVRVAGTDLTTSYASAYKGMNTEGTSTSFDEALSSTTLTRLGYFSSGTAGKIKGQIDMFAPFLSETTMITGQAQSEKFGARKDSALIYGMTTVTTSYTGFTLFPSSGTMTGTVQVYGYKD